MSRKSKSQAETLVMIGAIVAVIIGVYIILDEEQKPTANVPSKNMEILDHKSKQVSKAVAKRRLIFSGIRSIF